MVAFGAYPGHPLLLAFFQGQIDPQQFVVVVFLDREIVHPDNNLLPGFNGLLIAERGVVNLALLIAVLNRLDGSAQRVDPLDILDRLGLQFVGQGFDKIRTGQRVNGVRSPGLVGDDLLGTQRHPHRVFGRQGQGFVFGVGMQRVGPAQGRGQGLEGHADDIIVRLLGGQRRSCGLGMSAQHPRARVFGRKALLHDFGPQPPCGPELGHFLKEIIMYIEKERQPGRKPIDIEADGLRGLNIGDAVGQGKRDFLGRGRAGLTDVVAGDRNRIPVRHPIGAKAENIRDDPQGRTGRINIRAASDILFEQVVLNGAVDLIPANALFFRHHQVERQQNGGRGIDGHGGADLVQRNTVQQGFHVGQ